MRASWLAARRIALPSEIARRVRSICSRFSRRDRPPCCCSTEQDLSSRGRAYHYCGIARSSGKPILKLLIGGEQITASPLAAGTEISALGNLASKSAAASRPYSAQQRVFRHAICKAKRMVEWLQIEQISVV